MLHQLHGEVQFLSAPFINVSSTCKHRGVVSLTFLRRVVYRVSARFILQSTCMYHVSRAGCIGFVGIYEKRVDWRKNELYHMRNTGELVALSLVTVLYRPGTSRIL